MTWLLITCSRWAAPDWGIAAISIYLLQTGDQVWHQSNDFSLHLTRTTHNHTVLTLEAHGKSTTRISKTYNRKTLIYLSEGRHWKPSCLLFLSLLQRYTTFHLQSFPQRLQRPDAAGGSTRERRIEGLSQLCPYSVPVHSSVGVFPKVLDRVYHRMDSPKQEKLLLQSEVWHAVRHGGQHECICVSKGLCWGTMCYFIYRKSIKSQFLYIQQNSLLSVLRVHFVHMVTFTVSQCQFLRFTLQHYRKVRSVWSRYVQCASRVSVAVIC